MRAGETLFKVKPNFGYGEAWSEIRKKIKRSSFRNQRCHSDPVEGLVTTYPFWQAAH